jgi:hypothetical protein
MARATVASARGPGPRGVCHVSSSIVSPAPAARPAPPPARHGTCRWQVYIAPTGQTGGKTYAVTPLGAQPGFKGTWRLRNPDSGQTYTVAAPRTGRPGCTCPDHETRGTVCKHIRALAALGLLKAPKDKPAPSRAKGRKAHARNARAAVAEANALPAETRRHLAAMGPEPGSLRTTDRSARRPAGAALWEPPRPLDELMPLPPAPVAKALPPAPEGSFTAGFRQAIADHLARKHDELIECAACRYPFDPEAEGSAPLALCGPCLDDAKGGRS